MRAFAFAPSFQSAGANVGKSLCAQFPPLTRCGSPGLRRGSQELGKVVLQFQDLLLDIGCLAELLWRELIDRVHNSRRIR